MKEPYYLVHFDAAACLFEIRVNDQPVLTMNLTGQASSGIPINYAISNSGKQEVTIKVLPLLGTTQLSKKAYLNYHIKLFESYQGFKLTDQFDGFESKPVEDQVLPLISGGSTFEATIPYNLKDYWKEGENIEDIDDYPIKIRNAYQGIANLILQKKYNSFKQKMINREHNMSVSMYLSKKESDTRINRMVQEFSDGYDHLLFDDKKAIPVISAYGKKIALKRSNGEPALSFGSKKEKEQIMLDIEFYFNKESNQFEII